MMSRSVGEMDGFEEGSELIERRRMVGGDEGDSW